MGVRCTILASLLAALTGPLGILPTPINAAAVLGTGMRLVPVLRRAGVPAETFTFLPTILGGGAQIAQDSLESQIFQWTEG